VTQQDPLSQAAKIEVSRHLQDDAGFGAESQACNARSVRTAMIPEHRLCDRRTSQYEAEFMHNIGSVCLREKFSADFFGWAL
jgi:hypothetical protein